jgi:hypothetical protein
MKPAVSVLTPTYNSARFLGQAISSIRSQTFEDWELIVVDDGSTDRTTDVLHDVQDARLRVITHDRNRGIVAARNTAVAAARGEFIAVLDADDVALPNRLAQQVAYLRAHPNIGGVGSAIERIDETGRVLDTRSYPCEPSLVAWAMMFFNPIVHSTLTIRHASLLELGPYNNHGAEDYGLLARAVGSVRLANVPDVLVQYRISSTQATATISRQQEAEATEIAGQLLSRLTAAVPRETSRHLFDGGPVAASIAHTLRGLARNQYPSSREDIENAAAAIAALVVAFSAGSCQACYADQNGVRRDAAARLILLGLVALRRWHLATAVSLGIRSLVITPRGLILAAEKGWQRIRPASPS